MTRPMTPRVPLNGLTTSRGRTDRRCRMTLGCVRTSLRGAWRALTGAPTAEERSLFAGAFESFTAHRIRHAENRAAARGLSRHLSPRLRLPTEAPAEYPAWRPPRPRPLVEARPIPLSRDSDPERASFARSAHLPKKRRTTGGRRYVAATAPPLRLPPTTSRSTPSTSRGRRGARSRSRRERRS